ncbi:MAG: class I mannose-6-phosphate isomerase [Lachnospiraceae bacterium]|nr:class I mannose-6-phosphate isomerase [Lachnospiraceae bacterium]
MSDFKPFKLKPAGKDYLWGGERLNTVYNKNIEMNPLAETWECSVHPDGESVIASGEFEGMSLAEFVKKNPACLGTHAAKTMGGVFPILVKLIDAEKDLSVQVHPDDEFALINEGGSLGKTEMWYVLDAKEDASLIYGFHRDVTREEVENAAKTGNLGKLLNRIPVKKGNVFFIPSGTVHAIGAGALIAEVQENSNITYRLYDYDRVGKDGKKRPLHIEKALKVADFKAAGAVTQPMRTLRFKKGMATELLCSCKYFKVERLLLTGESVIETKPNSFAVMLCTEGKGNLDGTSFDTADAVFIPADSAELKISGRAEILWISC